MKNNRFRFSLKEYLRETFRDERRRKPFLVGLVVFVVVFTSLTMCGQATEEQQGDVILTSSDSVVRGKETDIDGDVGEPEGVDGADELRDDNAPHNVGADTEQVVILIDVGGAVNISGLFALPAGSRVADAIEAAGGVTEEAEVKYINRAATLSDGDRLYIPTATEVRDGTAPPTVGQVTTAGGYTGGVAPVAPSGSSADNGAGNGLINLNTANSEELQKLSGVGPVTAQKIIDYRAKKGGFKRIEDIMNVSGIGAKTFEKLKDHITI